MVVNGETLVLRDDTGERLGAWEAEISSQVAAAQNSARQHEVTQAEAVSDLDRDLE